MKEFFHPGEQKLLDRILSVAASHHHVAEFISNVRNIPTRAAPKGSTALFYVSPSLRCVLRLHQRGRNPARFIRQGFLRGARRRARGLPLGNRRARADAAAEPRPAADVRSRVR